MFIRLSIPFTRIKNLKIFLDLILYSDEQFCLQNKSQVEKQFCLNQSLTANSNRKATESHSGLFCCLDIKRPFLRNDQLRIRVNIGDGQKNIFFYFQFFSSSVFFLSFSCHFIAYKCNFSKIYIFKKYRVFQQSLSKILC